MRTVDHIRYELVMHDLPLEKIAAEIGVSYHSLYSFANKRSAPKADLFLKVCGFLGYELKGVK